MDYLPDPEILKIESFGSEKIRAFINTKYSIEIMKQYSGCLFDIGIPIDILRINQGK